MKTLSYLSRLALLVAMAAVPASAAAQTAQARYTAAKSRDDAVRKEIAATAASAPTAERTKVITEARSVISAYEALVRRYRASGYADNALYNAATLAEALHMQYALTTDLDATLRLFKRLRSEYPTAPLAKEAAASLVRLEPVAEAKAPAEVEIGPPEMEVHPLPAAANGRARLTGIERTVLPELVRVTLAIDREVAFDDETLSGPARLYFDFKGVEAASPLVDAVLRYPTDVVRQIRVGRHPNAIRVVLDLEGVDRHSVYALYNPFRIVIDAEPEGGRTTAAAGQKDPPPSRAMPSATSVAKAAAPPVAAPPPPPLTIEEEKPVVLTVADDSEESAASSPSSGAEAAPAAPLASRTPAVPPAPPPAPVTPGKPNVAGGFSIARQLGLGISRIVIDAGHGGHDPGAQAKGLSEAELTLDIALRLEKLLQAEPGLEVILTRRTNVYIPLEERTAIANREGADLFLSIHANTSRNTNARGVETYFLSFAASPDAEAVAARENASHAGEMHKLPDIIKAIALNNKIDESRDLAAMVQEALVTRLRRSNKTVLNRGVKKAPFVVLIGAEMPSVLAEVSFMTNRQEQQLLKTSSYKQRIAEALQAAVMRYRRSLKGVSAIAQSELQQ